jgi:nitroreductase/NAD-dependent dihydropyrimidine dehydrogenase PreA subunit
MRRAAGGGKEENAMEHVELNVELCNRDGLCAAVCPLGLLHMEGEGGLPLVREGMGAHCIGCGHCEAVCPTGALRLAEMAADPWPEIDRAALPSAEAVDLLMRSRRSVRAFRETPLERAELAGLLEVTRWAPTGHNAQAVEWCVAPDRAAVERVAGAVVEWMAWACEERRDLARTLFLPGTVRAWRRGKDIVTRFAPNLAVCHVPDAGVTPEADGIVAASWLELAAHARGLGACWCGYVMLAREHPAVRAALAIPEGRVMAAAMMLGRPRVRYRRIPPRKPLSVAWL